jgi:S-adenosylmethionine hydrolase
MAPSPVVLTTDFGLSDPYAGVMKGVVLSINPAATLIDLTHDIQPQNIRQGSFVLAASHRFFPPNSIHVVVVDPGVGTDRMAVLLVTPNASFLAPDNGLLSGVLKDYLATPPPDSLRVLLPPSLTAYQLTNSEYWLHPVSNTFHGRDIFSPVAAHLSLGVHPEAFGQPIQDLAWLPTPTPTRDNDYLTGEVIYADHYGNLVTNIPLEELANGAEIIVEIKGRKLHGLSKTFQSPTGSGDDGLLALGGSLAYLEVAVQNGSAAALLNAGPGEAVRVSQPRL